jgi:hypothetical protein
MMDPLFAGFGIISTFLNMNLQRVFEMKANLCSILSQYHLTVGRASRTEYHTRLLLPHSSPWKFKDIDNKLSPQKDGNTGATYNNLECIVLLNLTPLIPSKYLKSFNNSP